MTVLTSHMNNGLETGHRYNGLYDAE